MWVPFTEFFQHFDEEAFTLRSREQHCDDLESDPANFDGNSKEFGVNYRSQLLELRYFGGGLVTHDLLEGTLQYETKLTLKHVIGQHYITYKTFANLLEGLELGYMEMDNKPSVIPARVINSDDKHLGQKGTQKWHTTLSNNLLYTMMLYVIYSCSDVASRTTSTLLDWRVHSSNR